MIETKCYLAAFTRVNDFFSSFILHLLHIKVNFKPFAFFTMVEVYVLFSAFSPSATGGIKDPLHFEALLPFALVFEHESLLNPSSL